MLGTPATVFHADAARVRALAAYEDFLAVWKDANPDIPILKAAKAEYAKLQYCQNSGLKWDREDRCREIPFAPAISI